MSSAKNNHLRWFTPGICLVFIALVTVVLFIGGSVGMAMAASQEAATIVTFDPDLGQLPEGVTVDKQGNIFAGLAPLGQLVKIRPGSGEAEPFGAISGLQVGDIGLLGLATDAPGNIYGGVFSANPDAHGVWRFDRKTGVAERILGTEAILFPNAIAFDKQGTMYVTDTIAGAVWRVPKGSVAELWITDDLLAGDGSAGFPFPLGANGIAVRQNTIYVGVTESANIVTIPINVDGSAGTPEVLGNTGMPVDGIALDVHGNVYVAAPLNNKLVRVNTDGSVETVTESNLFDNPTSLVFGSGRGDRQSVYVVNFSVALGTPLGAGPSVLRVPIGEPGWPQP
jgi:sugar lactone lactonase YvrE